MQLKTSLLFLLSSNVLFCAELQDHTTALPTPIIPATAIGSSLQDLCIDVIVTHRIDSKMLSPYLQSEIAHKEKEKTHAREFARRNLLTRLQDDNAYVLLCNNVQDDPDHISQLFPTLHNQYLTVHASDSSLKKCLACLATKGITPGHSIRYLSKGCIFSLGISAALSPVIFVPTVICCPPMVDPILNGLLCFQAAAGVCSCLSRAAHNRCNHYTHHCYDYLTDPGEAPQPIVMEEYLDWENSLEECAERQTIL